MLAQTVIGPKVPAEMGAPASRPAAEIVSPGGRVPLVTENVGAGDWTLDVNWWA